MHHVWQVLSAAQPCSQAHSLQLFGGGGGGQSRSDPTGEVSPSPGRTSPSSFTEVGIAMDTEPVLSPEGKLAGKLLEKIFLPDKKSLVRGPRAPTPSSCDRCHQGHGDSRAETDRHWGFVSTAELWLSHLQSAFSWGKRELV